MNEAWNFLITFQSFIGVIVSVSVTYFLIHRYKKRKDAIKEKQLRMILKNYLERLENIVKALGSYRVFRLEKIFGNPQNTKKYHEEFEMKMMHTDDFKAWKESIEKIEDLLLEIFPNSYIEKIEDLDKIFDVLNDLQGLMPIVIACPDKEDLDITIAETVLKVQKILMNYN